MTHPQLPRFPYGAVYFRYSNPPQEDWERDYRTTAEDGMTVFRHWFLWSAVEVAPGHYDWSPYDRQMDLAAENGIKTIIAEMITAAPEWAHRHFAHARFETRDGQRVESHMSGSCVTGGFPGLCLDNDGYRASAERFVRELVTHYRDHPGLGGYDIWNECNYAHNTCYCPATAERFREWLRELRALALGMACRRLALAYASGLRMGGPDLCYHAPVPSPCLVLRNKVQTSSVSSVGSSPKERSSHTSIHGTSHGTQIPLMERTWTLMIWLSSCDGFDDLRGAWRVERSRL